MNEFTTSKRKVDTEKREVRQSLTDDLVQQKLHGQGDIRQHQLLERDLVVEHFNLEGRRVNFADTQLGMRNKIVSPLKDSLYW